MSSNTHSVYEWYTGLPGWARGVVVVTAVGTTLAVGYSIWKAVKQAKEISRNKKEAKDAVGFLGKLADNGVTPTYSDAQFEAWSNSLVQAFGGCGTDEATVYSIISSMNNEADLYKLIAVYGTRQYDGCAWGDNKNVSLAGAISDELDMFEKKALNAALATKGISFTFS